MIVLDKQSAGDEIYIGIQRPDRTYTYLHWESGASANSGKHHFTEFFALLEDFREIYTIGPNTLVLWSS